MRAALAAHLIPWQHAGLVRGAPPNWSQHHQAPAGWLLRDEQAHPLHLPVAADAEVGVLPAGRGEWQGWMGMDPHGGDTASAVL